MGYVNIIFAIIAMSILLIACSVEPSGKQFLRVLDNKEAVFSCDDVDRLSYDESIVVYTSDCKGYKLNEVRKALDRVFSYGKPVILFIHGRGGEPNKSLKGGRFVDGRAVQKLERQYNARVLMFSWDSKRGSLDPFDRERPLRNIPNAARRLNGVLEEIKRYRANERVSEPFTLLAHSMGTIVLQRLVEDENLKAWPNAEDPLFSNVILSSSDADNLGHPNWVEKIASVERTYITFNNDDHILKRSIEARRKGAVALGLDPGEKYAKKVKYINLTGLGGGEINTRHEAFNKCGMFNQVNVCRFYDSVLKGEDAGLDHNNSEIHGQVYNLKFEISKNDSCFISCQGP